MKQRTDAERLEWLARSHAHMAFSHDGEDCWLHWAYGKDGGYDGDDFVNQSPSFGDIREAIDAAMDTEEAGVEYG